MTGPTGIKTVCKKCGSGETFESAKLPNGSIRVKCNACKHVMIINDDASKVREWRVYYFSTSQRGWNNARAGCTVSAVSSLDAMNKADALYPEYARMYPYKRARVNPKKSGGPSRGTVEKRS